MKFYGFFVVVLTSFFLRKGDFTQNWVKKYYFHKPELPPWSTLYNHSEGSNIYIFLQDAEKRKKVLKAYMGSLLAFVSMVCMWNPKLNLYILLLEYICVWVSCVFRISLNCGKFLNIKLNCDLCYFLVTYHSITWLNFILSV